MTSYYIILNLVDTLNTLGNSSLFATKLIKLSTIRNANLFLLVEEKEPIGYISEIRNLVPVCGKCNQSKGNSV
jgi:hypothetical protein